MNKAFTIFFFLIFTCLAYGQDTLNARELRREAALTHARSLKNGALLVRLRTNLKQLEALENAGKTKQAKQYKKDLQKEHMSIIKAFKENYKYSRFYFFYSDKSSDIKEGKLAGNIYTDSLTVLPNDQLDFESDLYILDPYTLDFESMQTSQKGMVILDRSFNQLDKPFPYYVRKRQALFFLRRSYAEMVSLLNQNLQAFY